MRHTLGLAEAATYAGLSTSTINGHRKKGKLRSKKEDSGFRFRKLELDKLLLTVTPRKKRRKGKRGKKTASRRPARKETGKRRGGKRQATKPNGKANGQGAAMAWMLLFRGYLTPDMSEDFLVWAANFIGPDGNHRISSAGELALAWSAFSAAKEAA